MSSTTSLTPTDFTTSRSYGAASEFSEEEEKGMKMGDIENLMRIWTDLPAKRSRGKICIVDGSKTETNSLFSAIEAALQCQPKIIIVLTTSSGALHVKSYSSLLTVLPCLPEEKGTDVGTSMTKIWPLVEDSHTFCIGPGLGKDELIQSIVIDLILRARISRIPVVLSSDALPLLKQRSDLLTNDLMWSPVVVIANELQFEEIWRGQHTSGVMSFREDLSKTKPYPPEKLDDYPRAEWFDLNKYPKALSLHQTAHLGNALGPNVIILRTGLMDITVHSTKCFIFGGEKLRDRFNGQEDILAGLVSVFLSWLKLHWKLAKAMVAVCSADIVTRLSVLEAYSNCKNNDQIGAKDVAKEIPGVIENIALAASSTESFINRKDSLNQEDIENLTREFG